MSRAIIKTDKLSISYQIFLLLLITFLNVLGCDNDNSSSDSNNPYSIQTRTIKISDYNSSDELYGYRIQKYNLNDDLLENTHYYTGSDETMLQYITDDNVTEQHIFEYNVYGNLIKQSYLNMSNFFYATYQYDYGGNMIKTSRYNEFDELTGYYMFEYNTEGDVIKSSQYNESRELTEYETFELDPDGFWIISYYNTSDELVGYSASGYDAERNEYKRSYYDESDELIRVLSTQYDTNGNDIYYSDVDAVTDELIYFYTKEYDSNGILIKYSPCELWIDDSCDYYTYDYDSGGNLVNEWRYGTNDQLKGYKIYEYY